MRRTIKKIGGTMPENLPTPVMSAKQLEKKKVKELTGGKTGGRKKK